MKKTLFYFSILTLTLLIGFYSCKPDDDNKPANDPVGSWKCEEMSKMHNASTFTVTISKNAANSSYVDISNFYNLGGHEKALGLVTDNTITISGQIICGGTINGSGTFQAANKINWNYTINDGADIDTCTAVFTKW